VNGGVVDGVPLFGRSEEHTSELQSPLIISYAVFCLKKKKTITLKVNHRCGSWVSTQSGMLGMTCNGGNSLAVVLKDEV
jgi:hypothetical protein